MDELTWTCHVCGSERPDERISVHSSRENLDGLVFTQNVRYCNDNPDCRRKAPSVSFIKGGKT